MNRDTNTLSLFFPQPLDDLDFSNLAISRVRRVQMFLGVAYNHIPLIRQLAEMGCRLIVRLEEPRRDRMEEIATSYYGISTIIGERLKIVRQYIPIEAVICGNEPENGYDLTKDGENWGNQAEANFAFGRAWMHNWALGNLRATLKAQGLGDLPVVAPGWSHKRVTPYDPPQPGRATWATICADEYARGPVGLHAYEELWYEPEDPNRFLWHVGYELERIHTDAWLNECNITRHSTPNAHQITENDRMWAILQMFDLLLKQPWSEQIKSVCPFVSNGLPDQSWSHMIMRDPACYRLLGEWLRTK